MNDPSLKHENQRDQSTTSTTPLPKDGEDTQVQQNHEVSVSTPPPDHSPKSSSEKVPTTESPPTQLMERSDNSSYRIPPSVFDRTKSTAPGEWSTVSNESLFSIRMDTMSFTKDQFLWRSGELDMNGEPSTSGQMFSFSPTYSLHNSSDFDKGLELGVAVETMKEVIKESAEGQSNEKLLIVEEHKTHHRSRDSGTSTTSFAFPVLTGELEKDASAKINGPINIEPEKVPPEAPPKTETLAQPKTSSKKEAPPEEESKTPKKNPNAAQSNWFSCLPCCRSSS
ncbi:hypothetical protein LguiB_022928 [Lonicera macranthoides]